MTLHPFRTAAAGMRREQEHDTACREEPARSRHTETNSGRGTIEAVELHRIFPPVASAAATQPMPVHSATRAPDAAPPMPLVWPSSRAVIADLRQDRDQWREQAQRLALPRSR